MANFTIEVHLRKKNQREDGRYDLFFDGEVITIDCPVYRFSIETLEDLWDPFSRFLNKEDIDKVLRNDIVIYERN